jgi:FKBP-type peptidyl-prolyl cis-trans isomerases 1
LIVFFQRIKPASFVLSQVIKGWTEGLSLMKPGATWELYIPANLAYGKEGIPGVIGPNEMLIFKVHLRKVN